MIHADFEIYRSAKRLIDQCGADASEHAYRMMRQSLEEDDPQRAGDWLAIGNAIENLQSLPAADRLH